MGSPNRYPPEVRERAVRIVFSQESEHDSQWAAICSISAKLGMTSETLRRWVRQAEIDEGRRAGCQRVSVSSSTSWNARTVSCGVRTRS